MIFSKFLYNRLEIELIDIDMIEFIRQDSSVINLLSSFFIISVFRLFAIEKTRIQQPDVDLFFASYSTNII